MRKSYSVAEHESELRKGPWTAEEDEILNNFVKKYGPRNWSSIRSKGLLPRTGKSCRLRWVNKLRPNLKVGCKFSAEEERLVVEMQSRIGNKWATIASYLSGRTDNDVKNFWSSRKKRLARTRQSNRPSASSSSCSSSTLMQNRSWRTTSRSKYNSPVAYHAVPPFREATCSTTVHMTEEASSTQISARSSLSSAPCMPDTNIMFNTMKNSEQSTQTEASVINQAEYIPHHSHSLMNPLITQPSSLSSLSAHPCELLFSSTLDPQPEVFPPPLLPGSQVDPIMVPGLGGCCSMELFPHGTDAAVHGHQFGVEPHFNIIDSPFFGQLAGGGRVLDNVGAAAMDMMEEHELATPDSFFDDFPTDVFDSLDPLPTSSDR